MSSRLRDEETCARSGECRQAHIQGQSQAAEFGYPEFDLPPWMGIFTRAGTPADIVQRLETELIKAVTHPDVKSLLNKVGLEVAPLGSKDFDSLIKRDIMTWAKIIKDAGAKAE